MIDNICEEIIRQLHINRFVETGTDKGETVALIGQWFSSADKDFGTITRTVQTGARSYNSWNTPIAYPIFDAARTSLYQVHSVDADLYSFQRARENFKTNPNIFLYHSSSEEFLSAYLGDELKIKPSEHTTLFFLDAHWGNYWPLRDEIKIIAALNKYLIIIDDVMVPGKSDLRFPGGDFGFDVYKGQVLNWAYVSDLFSHSQVRIFYPTKPNRDRRGWVLIAAGYQETELAFLGPLGLFEIGQFDERHTRKLNAHWRSSMNGRSLLKKLVPLKVLRSLHRLYEKILWSRETAHTKTSS